MVVLRRLSILIEQRPVKSKVNFQNRKMFKVFFDTIDREDLFDKGFPTHIMDSTVNGVSSFSVNFSYPSSVTIASRSDEDVWMQVSELILF